MNPVTRRKRSLGLLAAAVSLWLAAAAPSHAHIAYTAPGPQTGLTYEVQGTVGHDGTFTESYSGSDFGLSLGARSWAEPGNPAGAKGWTHTSNWVALDLSALHDPALVTIQLERGATGSLVPAFSLYSGWELNSSDASNHTYNNIGNISWADDLTYLTHVANAGGPDGTNTIGTEFTSVSGQYVLAPGFYSIALGGNPLLTDPPASGSFDYTFTLSTAPVPVPAALWLFGSGLTGIVALARQKVAA
jgi:hypothetical protein